MQKGTSRNFHHRLNYVNNYFYKEHECRTANFTQRGFTALETAGELALNSYISTYLSGGEFYLKTPQHVNAPLQDTVESLVEVCKKKNCSILSQYKEVQFTKQ